MQNTSFPSVEDPHCADPREKVAQSFLSQSTAGCPDATGSVPACNISHEGQPAKQQELEPNPRNHTSSFR